MASRTLDLPAAGLSDLAAIRTFVRTAATSLGVQRQATDDLVVAVDDAAANVINHGYGGRPGPLEVEVSGDDDEVVVRLRDRAPVFDPTTRPAPDLGAPLGRRAPGGLGIHLARTCVDRMEHRRRPGSGNELTLVRRLSREPDAGKEGT